MEEKIIVVSQLEKDSIKTLSLMCRVSLSFRDFVKSDISFENTAKEDLDVQILKSILNT